MFFIKVGNQERGNNPYHQLRRLAIKAINTDIHLTAKGSTMTGAAMIAFDLEDQREMVKTVGMRHDEILVDGVTYTWWLENHEYHFIVTQ